MARTISVKIGRFGERAKTLKLPAGTTIGKALKQAGVSPARGEKVWLDGEATKPTKKLGNGDILNIVGSKDGGL